jgi:glycosyltransferase involved in cell wall biosynthesis
LDGVLREISRERRVRLLVIGSAEFSIPGVDVEAIPWREPSEVADLQRIDIGLYPLPEDEWVLGKSGLKALQYMALGIPAVATAIGANHRVVLDGVTGFLVRTPEEWKRRILELIDDPSLRRRLGEAARRHVEKTYSVRANRDTYLGILKRVVG